jgi:uncharacterized tellurite resistance protein B-like protein
MISRLRTLFSQTSEVFSTTSIDAQDGQQLAAAALLVEVATVDRRFDDEERRRIVDFVRSRFALSEVEADALVEAAQSKVDGSTQLYGFTTAIKNGFSYEERVRLMETLWEVVYADGKADPFEDQLMRRIGGLICVTDRDRGLARRRAQSSAR